MKPNKTADPMQPGFAQRMKFGCSPAGRFSSSGFLLIKAVSWAWNVEAFQVSGLPAWTNPGSPEAYYDIEAIAGKPVSTDECRLMIRTMLADRFNLGVHREMRLISVYALVPVKGGAKLREAADAGASNSDSGVVFNGHALPALTEGGKTVRGLTMTQLADQLSYTTGKIDGRRVIDETGMQGRYEVHLEFDQFPAGLFGHDKPGVFDAVQQQLGLRLEERKRSFGFVVVDRIEKPSAN